MHFIYFLLITHLVSSIPSWQICYLLSWSCPVLDCLLGSSSSKLQSSVQFSRSGLPIPTVCELPKSDDKLNITVQTTVDVERLLELRNQSLDQKGIYLESGDHASRKGWFEPGSPKEDDDGKKDRSRKGTSNISRNPMNCCKVN